MTTALSSDVALNVYREDRPPQYLGNTLDVDEAGRPKAIAVPAGGWFVRPIDPRISAAHLPPILDEVSRKSIPGLSLAGCRRIDNAAASALAQLAHLEFLELFNTAVTDEDLSWLGQLSALARLSMAGTKIGDAGLAIIAKQPALRVLDLGWTEVTDRGLEHLRDHPSLVSLSLRATKISDAGLAALAALPALRYLDLQETGIGDAGIAKLRPLAPTLEHLLVGYTRVTDRCLDDLATFRALRTLGIRVTRISRERERDLVARLTALGTDGGRGLVR